MSENHQSTHDGLERVIEAFQQMTVPDRPPDAELVARLGAYRRDQVRPTSLASPSKKSRHPMRLLVSSAVAALLLAGALAFLLLPSTAPIAVADVVKTAVKHKLVRYKQEATDTKEHGGSPLVSTVYADLTAPRQYSESRIKHPDGEAVHVSIHGGGRHLTTNSRQQTARLGRTPKDFKSFCCSLEEFEHKKGVIQVRENLSGLTTVKYRFEEDNQTSTLWVDAKTKLPVRMEQELTDPTADITCVRFVWTDFVWDAELPEGIRNLDALFSTRPPQGYALDDQTKSKKQE